MADKVEGEKGAPAKKPPVGAAARWMRVAAIVFAALLAIFGVRLMLESQAEIGAVHKRNFENLNIAAQGLEGWPVSIAQVARANYGSGETIEREHPDIGRYTIRFPACDAGAAAGPVFERGSKAGQGWVYRVSGQFVPAGADPATAARVCFTTEVPLDRLVNLHRAAPDFSHLLIAGANGQVIAQLGDAALPVQKLPEIRQSGWMAKDVARTVTATPGKGVPAETAAKAIALDDLSGTGEVQIGGAAYRLYAKPFTVAGHPNACIPMVSADTAAMSGKGCYAIGLMPAERLRRAWLSPPVALTVGFGLALIGLIALLPWLRLMLVGGGESLSPIEALGVVLGIQAVAAVATLALLFTAEIFAERRTAENEAVAVAKRLANQADGEIGTALREAVTFGRGGKRGQPLTEAIVYVDERGEYTGREGDARQAQRVSVGYRDYFRNLVQGETHQDSVTPFAAVAAGGAASAGTCLPGTPSGGTFAVTYTVGQVRAQTDGSAKAVVAMACEGGAAPGQPRYALAAFLMRSLFSPVLPDPQKFLVVDLGNNDLRVLFHSEFDREGTESFANNVDAGPAVLGLIGTAPSGREPGARILTLRYNGEVSRFAIRRLARANWAVLVYHPLDQVDSIASVSATRAVSDWFSIVLIAMLILAIRFWSRPDRWRDVWPDTNDASLYRDLTKYAVALAAGAAFLLLAMRFLGLPPYFRVILGVLCWIAALVLFVVPLSRIVSIDRSAKRPIPLAFAKRERSSLALSPQTERSYRKLLLAMLLCCSVVPVAGFWTDARSLSRELADAQRETSAVAAARERYDRTLAYARTAADAKLAGIAPLEAGDGLPNSAGSPKPRKPSSMHSYARLLWSTQFDLPQPGQRCEGGTGVWLCWKKTAARQDVAKNIGIVPHRTDWIGIGVVGWIAIAMFAGVLALIVVGIVHRGLGALMGFGVPLGAVAWNSVRLGDLTKLPPHLLLVAPQQAVRNYLSGRKEIYCVDLAELFLTCPEEDLIEKKVSEKFQKYFPETAQGGEEGSATWLAVSGLTLVLRDGARRRAALSFLEIAERARDRGRIKGIIMISEISPLERILDAFETEEDGDTSVKTAREELRWSRFFQAFATKSFMPIDKIDNKNAEIVKLREDAEKGDDSAAAKLALIDDLRWLPGNIIDGAIENYEADKGLTSDAGVFPLAAEQYREHYTDNIVTWAKSIKSVSPAASVDFLRSHLIEHYEQCWAASTRGERLVLEAIARGHFVNMRHAISLKSLVRRGLVVLDPAPRLLAKSFAEYVRQAERPGTLKKWRDSQPKSGWSFARIPLFVMLPGAVILLAIAAAESGQELTAVFSLVAAGAPVLLNSLLRLVRPAG